MHKLIYTIIRTLNVTPQLPTVKKRGKKEEKKRVQHNLKKKKKNKRKKKSYKNVSLG